MWGLNPIFSFENTKYFNTHIHGESEKVLKKLIVVYIEKDLTLEYITEVLNLFNSHSFSYVGINPLFFLLRILNILTHIHTGRGRRF